MRGFNQDAVSASDRKDDTQIDNAGSLTIRPSKSTVPIPLNAHQLCYKEVLRPSGNGAGTQISQSSSY
jgi:hypothetical protein